MMCDFFGEGQTGRPWQKKAASFGRTDRAEKTKVQEIEREIESFRDYTSWSVCNG